jgi:Sec-independent protein translocase protein TatA
VGLGTESLFMITLGLVVLGPKRLHAMIGHVARAKAELENATRSIESQLGAELNEPLRKAKPVAPTNQERTSEPSSDTGHRNSKPAG